MLVFERELESVMEESDAYTELFRLHSSQSLSQRGKKIKEQLDDILQFREDLKLCQCVLNIERVHE